MYRAEPDGYTLLSAPPPPLVINRLLYQKLSYDSSQFVPITVIGAIPNVLLVHPKINVGTVQELIALAKANPGKLNYASQGSGSTSHLTAELFKSMAGGLQYHAHSVQGHGARARRPARRAGGNDVRQPRRLAAARALPAS